MQKGSKSLRGQSLASGSKSVTPYGVILERFKKLNAQGSARRTDLVSEFFVHYYLRSKKSSI